MALIVWAVEERVAYEGTSGFTLYTSEKLALKALRRERSRCRSWGWQPETITRYEADEHGPGGWEFRAGCSTYLARPVTVREALEVEP